MLILDRVRTWLAASLIVITTLAIAMAIRGLVHRDLEWRAGTIERGSLHHTSDGYALTLVDPWAPTKIDDPVEVLYDGVLPDTVCEGVDVVVQGWLDGTRFHAEQINGIGPGKYDPCWQWQCRPNRDRPLRCQDHGFE